MIIEIPVPTPGQGLHDISPQVNAVVSQADVDEALCTLYIQHISASLLIQENYDPSAKADLESWLNRLVPENDLLYTHTLEGADDMPAHIKSALTVTSLSIPVAEGRLLLGTWQGIFLWEHRHQAHQLKVIVHLLAS